MPKPASLQDLTKERRLHGSSERALERASHRSRQSKFAPVGASGKVEVLE
jgi:hypothetical protein